MTAYLLANAAHILSLGLVFGAIATLDLRLLGLFRDHSLAAMGPPLQRMAAFGLGCAAVTGLLLFSTRPATYLANPAFLIKLALIGLALVNVVLLHAGSAWRQALAGGAVRPTLRIAALVSLLGWAGVVLAGRWIAFLE